ncbi:MAG: alpha-xylosidase [Pseudomonadota bacterium]
MSYSEPVRGDDASLIPTQVSPYWNDLPAFELTAVPRLSDAATLSLDSDAGELLLTMDKNGVRLRQASQRNVDYGLVQTYAEPQRLKVTQTEEETLVSGAHLTIAIVHQPFSFTVYVGQNDPILRSATDGHFVRRHRVPPLTKTEQGWLLSLELLANDAIYGLGEKWGGLNKRGQLLRSYNHDALGVNAEISYKNMPFCWNPRGWGVFCHTPAPVTHAVGYAPWSNRSYCALIEDDYLDVFFLLPEMSNNAALGSNPGAEIIRSFTELTGRAPEPPAWSTGVILSKAYYRDADEILEAAKQVRERGMPCDVITFDGRAWQDTETRFAFEWSPSRYPNPEIVIDQLRAMNFKICVWEYPLISVRHPLHKTFAENGWLLKDKRTGEPYLYDWDRQAFGEVLTPLPQSGIVDFTHPGAYEYWRDAHKPLFDQGVDMIKADFGEQIEDDNMLAHNGESGDGLHNVYAFLYNKCVYEAAEMYSPSGPFLFSRAAWTGCQRFNSHWGGDPQADWEGMSCNIRGGLSWGLTGAPFYATDVGGFYKDTRDDALYVRWAQAGIFSAHFRLHGIGAREPWSYSTEAEQAVNAALRLRYRLQAYLLKTMRQSSQTGLPVQRAMVLAFPHEKQAWAFENQFMFGDDLLVVPCSDPGGMVEFYLPEGHWYPFDPGKDHSHDMLTGQKVYQRKLGLDEMAVFARSGTKIPLCRAVEHTAEHNPEEDIEEIWVATSTN